MKRRAQTRGRTMPAASQLLLGLLLSLGVSAGAIVLFALAIQLAELGENWITPVNQFIKSVEAEPARFRFERVPQETGADRGDSGVAHQADFLFRCFWCEFGEMGGHAEERNRFHKISCLW